MPVGTRADFVLYFCLWDFLMQPIQHIPVTVLTGFLGSGKTTLLKRILTEEHGHRIAVIENEFGEEGIDNELLLQDQQEQIVEMNNGCICCTVRGDLVRILKDLQGRRKAGEIDFERVIIETTGLADPGPVAQTFFIDDDVADAYLLDAVITVVDAKHAMTQLDASKEIREQVAFADRLLLSKVDLVEDDALLADALRIALSEAAHQVDVVADGELADQALRDVNYDLMVLDIGLPKMNGRDVLRRLRQRHAGTPVLVLSALERIEDRVDLLNLGADDFLQKPFHLGELDARVKALLRRAHRHANNELELGRIKLDIDGRRCFVDQVAMDLTAR
nr:response regulator [Betaproteobacteria bacterium]